LAPALRALSRQHEAPPYELIVADNGSTDGTRGVVDEWRRSYPVPLRYVFEPRPGPSNARNAGIAAARAPLIAFTDDDVSVDTRWVGRIHELAAGHPEIDCFGGKVLPIWQEPPPAWLDKGHWSPLALTDHGDEPFTVSAARPQCLITANLGVRRRAFERVGGFSPDFPRAQDHEWMLRFWRAGGVGWYEPSLVVWADVSLDRLTRRYHRRWHLVHGRYSARMRLRELTDPSGQLYRGTLPVFRRWAGVPRFVVRNLASESLTAIRLAMTGAPSAQTLAHVDTVYDLIGEIREGVARWWRGGDGSVPRSAPQVPLAENPGEEPL
jgi:glycosyltransferase involved in cell wall biosynthesis